MTREPSDQTATVAFLTALSGAPPVETHISYLFLGPDTVWKLKKAVRLPFLDFSRIEDRRHFCERELELNALAAPGLYRDVVPVVRRDAGPVVMRDADPVISRDAGPVVSRDADRMTRQDTDPIRGDANRVVRRDAGPSRGDAGGSLAIGGDGTVIDWVVRMARVPTDDFLEVRAAGGGLEPSMLDRIADAVAAFHTALPPVPGVRPDMRAIAEGNVRSALSAGLPEAKIRAWHEAILSALRARAAWHDARAEAGFVRRCHGDLHLGNLCLWRGEPVLFDALEFDESLATIDVAYDLAFLLMDLEHRLNRSAANRVLNRYVARTGDAGLVAGLPVFLSMRAMVRAHVEARSGHSMRVDGYLDAAARYLRPEAPAVVAIGGLPGTGKSTIARALARSVGPAPGALVLRSDEIRKRQHHAEPEQRLPPPAYTERKSLAVFRELETLVERAARGGHAVIADATFLNLEHRAMVEAAANRAGVPFLGFWLTAPREVLEKRIMGRAGDASDATVAVLRAIRNDPGPVGWQAIDAGSGEDTTLQQVVVLTAAAKRVRAKTRPA